MSTLPSWVNDFVAQAASQPSAARLPWLAAVRERALERFLAESWPTTRIEAWHHTSLAPLTQLSFRPGGEAVVSEALQALKGTDQGCYLVFVNGHYDAAQSSVPALPAGVQLHAWSQVELSTQQELLQSHWGEVEQGASTAALNLALAQDGVLIDVARGVQVEPVVHVVFVNTDSTAAFTRNVVRVQAGAALTLVEHYIALDDEQQNFTSATTNTCIEQDACFTHVKLQQESAQAFHLGNLNTTQERGSVYNSHSLSFGARLVRNDIATVFNGERCETLFNGLYYVDGRRHVDHNTVINHAQPNCISHEYYRGILADRARGVFSGRILVAKGADGTDAIQRSDSLLLSKLARSDARPELEIYADDVKCAHGATVGQLDADSLFYLRARGMSAEDAKNTLIYAFAAQSLERIANEQLRARATAGIASLLPGGLRVGELA
ncbi:Fe-S cluster assembly protein SufD [Alcaligenes endophyticus]|uniref:Fe-S cluster assembly protein SufD n=1 Tax=Alcaligenes endophyticus TaxID=1929088 RepID=A0ABT8EIT8_9BURK|nr:Fe-S cluster assembly protein SufD [Alcaligenes endophyticus]MCX5592474.1 Fe-S cluster assembly protein SufD [Alcaligenes endophyticus]MDN4121199.1 Fe-S cluster assembly protein SufD [Alcaligenes endophyticus]